MQKKKQKKHLYSNYFTQQELIRESIEEVWSVSSIYNVIWITKFL